jgi:glutamine synthetase
MYSLLGELEQAAAKAKNISDVTECTGFYKDQVLTVMSEVRAVADELEELCGTDMWPYPSYGEMLFSIS